jgi:hypothetical protein
MTEDEAWDELERQQAKKWDISDMAHRPNGLTVEQEPVAWMGITDNPYCDDADCNDPNGRAMRWHDKLLALHKQEIKQEPVPVGITCQLWLHGCALFDGIDLPNETLLYTAPPKREWIGLTEEERCTFATWLKYKTVNEIFDAIEAKLKEKNNG